MTTFPTFLALASRTDAVHSRRRDHCTGSRVQKRRRSFSAARPPCTDSRLHNRRLSDSTARPPCTGSHVQNRHHSFSAARPRCTGSLLQNRRRSFSATRPPCTGSRVHTRHRPFSAERPLCTGSRVQNRRRSFSVARPPWTGSRVQNRRRCFLAARPPCSGCTNEQTDCTSITLVSTCDHALGSAAGALTIHGPDCFWTPEALHTKHVSLGRSASHNGFGRMQNKPYADRNHTWPSRTSQQRRGGTLAMSCFKLVHNSTSLTSAPSTCD